ncbi:hypothetical protein NIES4106_35900 [Fischerella sp. NIES-4106]|jgi:hypothetical protein|nr:hypothetical protein NIES4106_35900 [Fischerella sp. NIES-4106]
MKGKSKQLIIDAYDITNASIQVAIDFVVCQSKGQKALHYIKDVQEISGQLLFVQGGNLVWC